MGKNAKFLYLSNGKFSEIFKIEIFLSLNLFLYELWSFKHQNFFWKFTLKAECSKIGTISDFWLYLPFFVVLQENIRFVLKTSLTKLSNEYKNIIIPQWNDWENWVWIRAADFIDVACIHLTHCMKQSLHFKLCYLNRKWVESYRHFACYWHIWNTVWKKM